MKIEKGYIVKVEIIEGMKRTLIEARVYRKLENVIHDITNYAYVLFGNLPEEWRHTDFTKTVMQCRSIESERQLADDFEFRYYKDKKILCVYAGRIIVEDGIDELDV